VQILHELVAVRKELFSPVDSRLYAWGIIRKVIEVTAYFEKMEKSRDIQVRRPACGGTVRPRVIG
jgi:hypothetical protein